MQVREFKIYINNHMNYQAAYDRLISYRREHPAQGYIERHHIIMRSMGGSNESTNLVVLTGREHWIAHLLLHKIHRNSCAAYACHMMAMRCEERGIPYVRNSRMYERIRKECAKLTGIRNSNTHVGEGNSQYGTRWICNLELQESRKISKDGPIPIGWILGRNKWKLIVNKQCLKCHSIFIGTPSVKYCSSQCRSRPMSDDGKRNISEQALLSGRNSGVNNGMHKAKLYRLASVSERASNA